MDYLGKGVSFKPEGMLLLQVYLKVHNNTAIFKKKF